MGLRMVRQPSETPNVSNIDDIIPFRYAYGDQNGYVIGRGLELRGEPIGLTFIINSGRVVLNGVETEVDPNGVSFSIDNASEKRYYSVYYEVNLATQTTAIKLSNYSTNGYPTIESGDDLTINPGGIAKLELYRFTATNGVISDVEKVVKGISYINRDYVNNQIDSSFSLNTPSQFGDFIVSKKRLIWSGNQQFVSNASGTPYIELGAYDRDGVYEVHTDKGIFKIKNSLQVIQGDPEILDNTIGFQDLHNIRFSILSYTLIDSVRVIGLSVVYKYYSGTTISSGATITINKIYQIIE